LCNAFFLKKVVGLLARVLLGLDCLPVLLLDWIACRYYCSVTAINCSRRSCVRCEYTIDGDLLRCDYRYRHLDPIRTATLAWRVMRN